MAFMGYETPVEMPSMGVYNTDLMKMYIAGVKDQYEKGQEEMKDFMKLYGDFYSDIPGATQAYNDLTLGGARDMINLMYAAGIDPYKSPEARAAISRYIASRPTGLLNQMKKSAENAAIYKKALAEALNDPNFDPEYNKYMLGGDLESWDPRKPWTALAPYVAPSAEASFKPYMEKFKQSEILPKDEQDRPGYIKVGTTKENKQGALRAALENYEKTPYGQYKRLQANQMAAEATNPDGTPLTPEQRQALAESIFELPAKDYARQFFQPAYEDDWRAKAEYQARVSAKYSGGRGSQNTNNSSGGYLKLLDSAVRGMASRFGSGMVKNSDGTERPHEYIDTQLEAINNGIKNKMATTNVLKQLWTDADAGDFAASLTRTAAGGSGNAVYLESGDMDNIYTSSEVLSRMVGVPQGSIYSTPTNYRKKMSNNVKIAHDSNQNTGVKITARQKVLTVYENDGYLHVYRPVDVYSRKRKMDENNTQIDVKQGNDFGWWDTGYRLDPATYQVDQNASAAAIQRDNRATIKQMGAKNSTSSEKLTF